jgi:hypothetical protein
MNTELDIPEDYRCPFCLDHRDYDFVWSELAEAYLCDGCYHEIYCGLDYDHQPTAEEYGCADSVEKLLEHLGISYAELQQRQKRLADPKYVTFYVA